MSIAKLKSHNQSPRKTRLVTELVKGKKIHAALAALQFLPKRAAEPVRKLIKSAVASAVGGSASGGSVKVEDLVIKNIIVENAGMTKKWMPRAFGRATMIRRRKSRVIVTLSPFSAKATKGK